MAKEEQELLEQIVEGVKACRGVAENCKGKKATAILKIIADVLPDVIEQVEIIGDGLESADKKELAIEACLTYLNIKMLPDGIERKMIGILIDASVKMLNKWFGKDWITKVNKVASGVWGWIKNLFHKVK